MNNKAYELTNIDNGVNIKFNDSQMIIPILDSIKDRDILKNIELNFQNIEKITAEIIGYLSALQIDYNKNVLVYNVNEDNYNVLVLVGGDKIFKVINPSILRLDDYGCYIELNSNNELLSYAMLENGDIDKTNEAAIITEPQSQDFLNEVNSYFGTNFKMSDFDGR